MKSEHMKSNEFRVLQSALGPQIMELFDIPGIEEIMRNPDGNVWVDKQGEAERCIGLIQSDANAKNTINVVATACGKICNAENPVLSGVIPGTGYRFQGLISPVVTAPTWTIRIPPPRVFTLDEYVATGIMTDSQKDAITDAVTHRFNILVVGGTRSGKTTLTNAILAETSKMAHRHVLIEDTGELRCSARNKVELLSSELHKMNDLLAATMRLNPTRIIVGEVKRGNEAYTLLMAWNTGHGGGISTLHANSAIDGLRRIEELLQEIHIAPVPQAIARAVHLVLFIEATPEGRKLREVARVVGYDGEYQLQAI